MDWQHILYSVDDGVAHVVLNRPEKLNALGLGRGSNRQELVDALELADSDDSVGAILVSAAGRAFCAGGDLVGVVPAENAYEHHLFIEQLAASNARVRAIHKPIVAAVHGMCLGSGLGLLAQFDFVIAADDCRFGLIEGRIGHPGATEIVPIVGPAWAKFLMLTGEIIGAARAEKIGLVLTTEPADVLIERCTELARRLARMPREGTGLNKATINGVADAMGRTAGTAVGRVHDVVTRDMSRLAKSPDGRLFDEILRDGGMEAMKAARDQQFQGPWLDR
ncbi:MAG: enoyl-CoA hydratase/isomerase family protein [Actinomycetota bacterium]|nr:enoyl-CoA hydratase/isomerase family protein [Actinomycetota bacterium]